MYGNFVSATVYITQTSPSATPLVYHLETSSNGGATYFQIGQSPLPPQTTLVTSMVFNSLLGGNPNPGMYRIILKDATGVALTSPFDFTIVEPSAVTATATLVTPVSCPGGNDGEVTVTPGGGTGAGTYTFLWDDPSAQTTVTATGLVAGTYSCAVLDANLCPVTSNSVTILDSPTFLYTVDSTSQTCSLPNGEVSITVTQGGTGLGTYSYSWLWGLKLV